MVRAKTPRSGKLSLFDDRSSRRFKVDVAEGAYTWIEHDDDNHDEDDGGGGDGSEMTIVAGNSLKVITVESGSLGIKVTNDECGVVTVLSSTGQAKQKGICAGDAVYAIAGQLIESGVPHHSISTTIKSMARPFEMSFLPSGATDPEKMGTTSTLQSPASSGAATKQTTQRQEESLFRPVEITFAPGPMGIDIRQVDGKDVLVKALLAGSFGGANNPDLIAVKRTIGQAQSLGIKPFDFITTVSV